MDGMRRFGCAVAVALSVIWSIGSASAETPLPAPSGPPILTVEGAIAVTNVGDTATFDRAMLEELGMRTLQTSNPFETGVQTFDGVLLRDVLRRVGATGEMLSAFALDGYTVEIPVSDVETYDVLLAMRWNGKVMNVRYKGPLWVIYPVDRHRELQTESYSNRTIWQLKRLVVR